MFARQSVARLAAQQAHRHPQNARNMATLREIELRLKSVRNIEKITKVGRFLVLWDGVELLSGVVDEDDCVHQTRKGAARHECRQRIRHRQLGCVPLIHPHRPRPLTRHAEIFDHTPSETPAKRKLFIVVSSDKGLCGGIHSSVSKATRRAVADTENPVDADSPIMVIGDKSKAQLARVLGKNLALTFNQIGRDIPTFADAAGVADLIVKSGVEYDSIALVYNRFVSAISYEAGIVEVANENTFKESRRSTLSCVRCV